MGKDKVFKADLKKKKKSLKMNYSWGHNMGSVE